MGNSGIKTPQDLKGKRIGLPGLFGASYVGLRALLEEAGLEEGDVKLESIGFNQVEALESGRVDAVVVYANNEPVQLRARGHDIVEFRVADYASLPSNGIITSEKMLKENPDLVKRFVQATIFGLRDTLEAPTDAFDTTKKFVELQRANQAGQLDGLMASVDFWKASRVGYSSPGSIGDHIFRIPTLARTSQDVVVITLADLPFQAARAFSAGKRGIDHDRLTHGPA